MTVLGFDQYHHEWGRIQSARCPFWIRSVMFNLGTVGGPNAIAFKV